MFEGFVEVATGLRVKDEVRRAWLDVAFVYSWVPGDELKHNETYPQDMEAINKLNKTSRGGADY